MTSQVINISLYIPCVFANLNKDFVKNVLEEFGKVSSVDFVEKMREDGSLYNAVYIHFEYWYETKNAMEFQNSILGPNEKAKLYYDNNSYWIVLKNNARKFVPGDRRKSLDLGDLEKHSVTKRQQEEVEGEAAAEEVAAPAIIGIAPGLDLRYFTKEQWQYPVNIPIAPGLDLSYYIKK